MNSDEKMEILKKREYVVVKGNELIQKSRFELSLQEQKTIAYICSMIKPVTQETRSKYDQNISWQLKYEFDIRDYCKICGLDYNNGKNYLDVKATLKKLRDRSMWLSLEDGTKVLVGWLTKAKINQRSGIVAITLDEDLVPYLFDLGQRFTQYQLYNILAMKSAFSIRIYELLKSYAFQGTKTFDIDELKHLLMVDSVKSYKNFKDFRMYVLEKAQKEINELTDIQIFYEPITKGRKVVKVKFQIEQKSVIDRMTAQRVIDKKLNTENT